MRVDGIDFDTFEMMPQDDVNAVIRIAGTRIDVGDVPIGGGKYRIGGLTAFVPLHAANVQAFVHLPALGADASERASDPGLADGADVRLLLRARFEDELVGGGKMKRLGER